MIPTTIFALLSALSNNAEFTSFRNFGLPFRDGEPVICVDSKGQISSEIHSTSDFQKGYPYELGRNFMHFYFPDTIDKCFDSDGLFIWPCQYRNYALPIGFLGNQVTNFSASLTEFEVIEMEDFEDENSVTSITNYEYFFKLSNNICHNTNGTCSYIANEMICSYYDHFLNDDFVPERYDKVSIVNSAPSNWSNLPVVSGCGFIGTKDDNRFQEEEIANIGVSSSLDINIQRIALDTHLENQGIPYSLTWCEGNLYDNWTMANKSQIMSTINSNRPILANGWHHSVVAFAYSSTHVYINEGWGIQTKNGKTSCCAKVPWAMFTDYGLFDFSPSSIDLIPDPAIQQTSNNNYYSKLNDTFFSSSGSVVYSETVYPSTGIVLPSVPNSTLSYDTYSSNYLPGHYFYLSSCQTNSGLLLCRESNIDPYFEIEFMYQTSGVFLSLTPAFSGPENKPLFIVEAYVDWSGITESYCLNDFTVLDYGQAIDIALNFPEGTSKVTIKVVGNTDSVSSLLISKAVFSV